jgi:hypothetical protein
MWLVKVVDQSKNDNFVPGNASIKHLTAGYVWARRVF